MNDLRKELASLKQRITEIETAITKKENWPQGMICVVQFHPPESEYGNFHPYCLHLWRKVGSEFETPPKVLV